MENCPKEIRTNPEVLDGIRIALQRGVKSISDLTNYASQIGAPYITNSTITHIFRGSNNGGVHHISALMADPNIYKIHNLVPTSNGCYKATIYKNGSPWRSGNDFFPDDWDEFKIMDEIKYAWNNKVSDPLGDPVVKIGTLSNGMKLKIVLESSNLSTIKTCFPQ